MGAVRSQYLCCLNYFEYLAAVPGHRFPAHAAPPPLQLRQPRRGCGGRGGARAQDVGAALAQGDRLLYIVDIIENLGLMRWIMTNDQSK